MLLQNQIWLHFWNPREKLLHKSGLSFAPTIMVKKLDFYFLLPTRGGGGSKIKNRQFRSKKQIWLHFWNPREKLLNKSGLSFAPTIMVKKLDSQKQSNTVKNSQN